MIDFGRRAWCLFSQTKVWEKGSGKRGAVLLVREICEVAARNRKGRPSEQYEEESGALTGDCGPPVGDACSSPPRSNHAYKRFAKNQGVPVREVLAEDFLWGAVPHGPHSVAFWAGYPFRGVLPRRCYPPPCQDVNRQTPNVTRGPTRRESSPPSSASHRSGSGAEVVS